MKNVIEMPQNHNDKVALQNIFDGAPASVDKWGDERKFRYKVRFFFNNNRSQLEYVWVKAAGVCDAQSLLISAAKDLNLDCTILGADNMGLINPPAEVETITEINGESLESLASDLAPWVIEQLNNGLQLPEAIDKALVAKIEFTNRVLTDPSFKEEVYKVARGIIQNRIV